MASTPSASHISSTLFTLYTFLFLYSFSFCSARDTISFHNPITDSQGESLVSAGERFELGFFPPNGSSSEHGRYVGIWYYKSSPRVVVWVANRDKPLSKSTGTGAFSIAEDGDLKIVEDNKTLWSADTGGSSTSFHMTTVKLLDSGNLVLINSSETILWQSFDHPTDTFLPGMKMNESIKLVSWKDSGDPGIGQFMFKKDEEVKDGYVITKIAIWQSPLRSAEIPYGIACLLSNFSKISCPSYFVKQSRLVMDYRGQLRYLKWDVEKNWSLEWRAPEDQCKIENTCGKFGICNINNRIVCKCLPGFKPSIPEKWQSQDFFDGCTRDLTLCDQTDTFLSLKMIKVRNKDTQFDVKNEAECRNKCHKECRCKGYTYNSTENSKGKRSDTPTSTNLCLIWNDDLTNLQEEYADGSNLFIRVTKSDIESTVRNCEPCGINVIPYPLSTRPTCGDPMYSSFSCNASTGQLIFKAPSGSYRVDGIYPGEQKFVIQVNNAENRGAGNSVVDLWLNNSLPFSTNKALLDDSGNFSSKITGVEISWESPLEPTCKSPDDCKDWPHSSCNATRDGKMRCLCSTNFQWNVSNLICTEGNIPGSVGGGVPGSLKEPSRRKMSLSLIVVVSLISVIVLTCSIIFLYIWRRKMAERQENRNKEKKKRVLRTMDSERHVKDLIDSGEFREEGETDIDLPFYDLESILAATDNFSDANKLGQGGYGPVYKGTFPGDQEIAVKRLSSVSGQGLQEFKNEVVLIAKLQHRNLVRLRGYCTKGDEKILLYEYMPNKSLDSFIFDPKLSVLLDWEMRFNIILGIARGLLYLHQDSRLRIIHRDLKTSNILLDQEMNPKISDFGLARIVGGNEIEANTTRVVGTYGYMSPEYALDGVFSIKSDVFSFGVVLLEIISGKKNTGFYRSEQAMSLIGYAWRLWTENKVLDLMDQTIHETLNAAKFMKCVNVGLLCIQEDPNDRPTMSNVITMLDSETGTVPTPKQPAFVLKRGQSSTASSSSRPETYTEFTTSVEEAQ